jgi:large subunit ribosomal protein L22
VEVVASSRQVRMSPRKVRPVLDTVRGKKVEEALNILAFLPSPAARTVAKVVKSATANAENNFHMSPGRLRIVRTYANEGQTLKRFHAGARGRVSPFQRHFSHITVIVEED